MCSSDLIAKKTSGESYRNMNNLRKYSGCSIIKKSEGTGQKIGAFFGRSGGGYCERELFGKPFPGRADRHCEKRTDRSGTMSRLLRSSRMGLLLTAAGLAMMGFGIYRGEAAVVLEKAINICLECIGIG